MSDINILQNAVHTVTFDGKQYTCNGERIIVDGHVMWMYRTRNGLDYDIVVTSDRNPDSKSEFYHLDLLPGQPASITTDEPVVPSYLTFTAQEDNSTVAFLYYFYAPEGTEPPVFNIQYRLSKDQEWQEYETRNSDEEEPMTIELNTGESVQFKGINPDGFYHYEELPDVGDIGYGMYCLMDGLISASGDITSILNDVGGDCPLPEFCYQNMFSSCESLTTAPELPSTTLTDGCYSSMFNGCTSLTTAPELPATTLAEGCYSGMFGNCTSLRTAPALPATTLVEACYASMFDSCTSLNSVTCLATDISATDCTDSWLLDVAQTGTFYKAASMDDWTEGDSGIPENWTVEDYSN